MEYAVANSEIKRIILDHTNLIAHIRRSRKGIVDIVDVTNRKDAGLIEKLYRISIAFPILQILIFAMFTCNQGIASGTTNQTESSLHEDKIVFQTRCNTENARWYTIYFRPCNFLTSTGKKVDIQAESGERLELWWVMDWLGKGRFFPKWYYELRYYEARGSDTHIASIPIGRCHFSEGCNSALYLAADGNHNGVPDSFLQIIWDSWDYGDDDGEKGYLDHISHVFNLCEKRSTVIKYLYFYPSGCEPPLSLPPEVCELKEECKPPYRLFKKEIMEERVLGQ